MKTKILLLVLPVIFAMGCNKITDPNDDDDNKPTTTPKVKSNTSMVVAASSTLTYYYTYNTDGTVSQIEVSNGTKFTYYYGASTVTQTEYDGFGAVQGTYTYYLNSAGLADSAQIVRGTNYSYETYQYDADKRRTEYRHYDQAHGLNSIYTFTVTGGNTTYAVIKDKNSTTLQSTMYTYDMNHKNTVGNDNTGQSFLGKSSSNVIESFTTNHVTTGTQSRTYTVTYDGDNKVTNATIKDAGGNTTGTESYTYY
jgi:hypothetical protein